MIPTELLSMSFLGEGIVREATEDEVHAFGRDLDAALGRCAVDTGKYSRDELALAYLALAESAFYVQGWRAHEHDGPIAPVLDHVLPHYPDDREVDQYSLDALRTAGPWMRASSDYHAAVDGIINVLQGRMRCGVTASGRFVFSPRSSFAAELRNRWFARRWHQRRESMGRAVLEDNAETRGIIRRLDGHVAAQDEGLRRGVYRPPDEPWYLEHADGIADRTLDLQFLHVGDTEAWAGLTKAQVIKAIRPLYVRAARRLFAHLRVFAYLRHRYEATGPVLLSVLEQARLPALVAEAAASAQLPVATAEAFVRSMVRTGREERYGIVPYPLLPLFGDRVALIPSAILFAGWPTIRERAATRARGGSNSVARARNRRHLERIVDAATAAGFRHISTEVPLVEPSNKTAITDLDVVVVSPTLDAVLIIQLKSFLTPTNLLDVDRADEDVALAVNQCERADAHRDLVRAAVEQALGVSLVDEWTMRQLIVVEAITGTREPSPVYPAVSIEWIEWALRDGEPDIDRVWSSARDLPDGREFFDSIAPVHQLFDDSVRDLKTGRSAAVFAYGSD